jgi:hypothetical protein
MKTRLVAFLISTFLVLAAKAQMPGGGGYGGGMMSPQMQNMPSGSSGPSKKEEPPHGGEIKEAGKYNIEVVFDPFANEEKLNVWLLKGNYKPAKTDKATGTVTIKYPKLDPPKEETKELSLFEDRFFCNVSEPSATFTAFITITVKGKEYKMVYNQKGMAGK